MPSKKSIFTPLSILFRPHQKPIVPIGFWWRRRVPPPGPMGLLHRPFIAIAARGSIRHIGASCGDEKVLVTIPGLIGTRLQSSRLIALDLLSLREKLPPLAQDAVSVLAVI